VGDGLIHEVHGGVADKASPQGDSLPLTPGELAREAVEERRDLEQISHLSNQRSDLALWISLPVSRRAKREGDVVEHRELGVEGIPLKYHGHVPLPRLE
jgi:hypothetical protein